jgi:excinuclease ABC subunit C
VGADDYASLTELLQRRMKYPMPDLLVIDGGKGQLMMIKKIFQINPHLKERCAYTDIICLGKGEARQKNKI